MEQQFYNEISLNGVIDMHIHTAPDIRPRYCDDVQAAKEAKEAGMRAILLKSHITITADRASIAEQMVGDISVFGGLVLNNEVGGFNPYAVEAAIQIGAKEIWMPTKDSANQRKFDGKEGGLSLLDKSGKILPEIHSIIDIVGHANAILATGHISIDETIALVSAARQRGLKKILITHPESPITPIPIKIQKQISAEGVFFERCFVDATAAMDYAISIKEIANAIREVGVASTILTTDFGLASLPSPVTGMREYLNGMALEGFNLDEICIMVQEIPSYLLDL